MSGRLEIRRWIRLNHQPYTVALSGDGRYAVAGFEQGVAVYNHTGKKMLSYPSVEVMLPIQQIAASPAFDALYLGAREGLVLRLNLKREAGQFAFQVEQLHQIENDLFTMSLAPEGEYLSLGHLSPGLTLLQTDGETVWHKNTEGQPWVVSFASDGRTLYVGSAGIGVNRLAALSIPDGDPQAYHYIEDAKVNALTALSDNAGVAAALNDEYYTGRLIIYDSALQEIWSHPFEENITALAADPHRSLVAVAVGYFGQVHLVDVENQQLLATEKLDTIVNDLALVQGRTLAAVTEEGQLALIRYVPEEFRL